MTREQIEEPLEIGHPESVLKQGLTLGLIVFAAVLAAMFAYGAIEKARIRAAIETERARQEQLESKQAAARAKELQREEWRREAAEKERRRASEVRLNRGLLHMLEREKAEQAARQERIEASGATSRTGQSFQVTR